MIHLSLTDAQQQELEEVSRHAIGRVALRAHLVLLAGRGDTRAPDATHQACPSGGAADGPAAHPATQGLAHLLCLDESELHLLPLVRAMWMKGRRVRVPTPGTTARHAFFGALDAGSGRWLWPDHERKLALHFVAFLEHLAAAYPTGQLYLALDGAPAHTAKVVQRWLAAHPRVIALRLPTYAAHRDNPADRLWGLRKDAVAPDRLVSSLTELVLAARRFFA